MTVLNQYCVKMYLEGFHPVEVGQKISNCEFGFEDKNKQYFLCTTISAENEKVAKRRGELRLNQVLSIFVLHSGMMYTVSNIHVNQISGEEPLIYSAHLILGRTVYLEIPKNKIEEIEKMVELLDRLPIKQRSTKIADKAINYFLRGCYLQTNWRSEAFLNFYKSIELISNEFRKSFDKQIINQLKNTLLNDLIREEIKIIRKPRRLIHFVCDQIGVSPSCDISRILEIRNQFSAHARLKEIEISEEDANNCKILAANTIINYSKYIFRKSQDILEG